MHTNTCELKRAAEINGENTRRTDKKIAAEIEKIAAFAADTAESARDCGAGMTELLSLEDNTETILGFLTENTDIENLSSCAYIFEALEMVRKNAQIKVLLPQSCGCAQNLPDSVSLAFTLKNSGDLKKLFLALAFYNLNFRSLAVDGLKVSFSAGIRGKEYQFVRFRAFLDALEIIDNNEG